jgi:hypothetical protein
MLNADCTKSLNNLSIHLSDLGHHEQALVVIQKAVNLYRQLVAECPSAFNAGLTISFNNFSNHLSALGQHYWGSEVIQEAVYLY